jgi:hypothetical protein
MLVTNFFGERRPAMKLAHFLGLVLTLAPLGANAQSDVPVPKSDGVGTMVQIGPDGQTKTLTITLPNRCPIAFQARHLADGDFVKTGDRHPPKGPGQRLHVTLTSPDARTLASATISVRGWTAQGHMENAGATNSPQSVRTMQVPLTAGTGRNASADLWVPGMTAVDSVELLSVSYADGSTWTPAAGKSCRITPDPLMLISN